jgi:Ca2+-binding RTX toxin-like protein
MVKFVAKTLPVDNSNLTELDNFKPFKPQLIPNIGYDSRYNNGKLSVEVTQNNIFKYKISKIEVEKKDMNKLFKGDNWEPNLFKGDDKLNGSSDADALYGFNGNDVIHGNAGDDALYGGKGKDELYGGDGDDTIFGGAGKDFLHGGAGINSLTGGAGKDTFLFDAALVAGNGNIITDFKRGSDHIELDRDVFTGIGNKGKLAATKFILADDYAGQDHVVIYDIASGTLGYSKTGGPIGNAVEFGAVAAGLALSNKDFSIV